MILPPLVFLALSFDSGFTQGEVNYAEKSFMKLTLGANAGKLFSSSLAVGQKRLEQGTLAEKEGTVRLTSLIM